MTSFMEFMPFADQSPSEGVRATADFGNAIEHQLQFGTFCLGPGKFRSLHPATCERRLSFFGEGGLRGFPHVVFEHGRVEEEI